MQIALALQFALRLLDMRDVGVDAHDLVGLALGIHERGRGRSNPDMTPILVAGTHLALPDPPGIEVAHQMFKKLRGVLARSHETQVLTQQLMPAVAAHLAKPVVGIGQHTRRIGDTDDGVMIQRQVLALTLVKSRLKAALHTAGVTGPPCPSVHRSDQMGGLNRLDEEIVAAQIECQQLLRQVGLAGHKQDGQVQPVLHVPQGRSDLRPAGFGHVDIEQDHIGIEARDSLHGVRRPAQRQNLHAGLAQDRCVRGQHQLLVVHQQHTPSIGCDDIFQTSARLTTHVLRQRGLARLGQLHLAR